VPPSPSLGVKLYTTIAYSGTTGIMVFEALNTKDFDVEVELSVSGEIKEASGSLPFKRVVRIGQRAEIGRVKVGFFFLPSLLNLPST